jgi:hypothetical protein
MRTITQLFGLLFIAAFFVHFFWWLVAIGAAWAVYRLVCAAVEDNRALAAREAAEEKAIRERADRQVDWFQSGDPRWVTGPD